MPTLAGMRRRGYTPEAIRAFCERIGVSKRDSMVDVALLEHCAARRPERALAARHGVLRPLKVVIDNYPEGQVEELDAPYNPEKPDGPHAQGAVLARALHRARRLPRGSRRRSGSAWPRGRRCACATRCIIRCNEVVKDDAGEVVELRCTWDPATRAAATPPMGARSKGPSTGCRPRTRPGRGPALRSAVLAVENPLKDKDVDWKTHLNPRSLEVLTRTRGSSRASPMPPSSTRSSSSGSAISASTEIVETGQLVFNRTISLKDSWAAQTTKSG